MKLILVRHAETEANIEHVFPDILPGKLSEQGESQSIDLGKKLAKKEIDVVFCSPAERCKRTWELIQKQMEHEIKVIYKEELQERDYGDLKGKPTSTMTREERDSDCLQNKQRGMEDHEEVGKRTEDFLNQLKSSYGNKTVMIVGHGEPLVWMCAKILNKSYEETAKVVQVKNAEAVEFEI